MFILEPYILNRITGFTEPQFNDFRWRFNLPPEYEWRRNSLTIGILAEHEKSNRFLSKLNMGNFVEQDRVLGSNGPFDNSTNYVHHIFYRTNDSTLEIPLHLHLVVLHPIKHFLWIGSLTESQLFILNDQNEQNPSKTYIIHYGRLKQEIYDPFVVTTTFDSIPVPDDIPHLLSQLPTSRYIHCSPNKTTEWFQKYNQTINENKVKSSEAGIIRMKSFMRKMKMEFWIACGTLL